jgi:RNA polymerase sigma factor (sigma-70 family)
MPEDTEAAAVRPPEDIELLQQLRRDPARGLPPVLARYERSLLRHAAAVVGDAAMAEDVVQETFLKLLANGHPVDNLAGWLHRVTHNLALDHLRRESRLRKLHSEAAPLDEPLAEAADRDLDRREAQAILARELGQIPPNERAVLLLKLKEGKSYREISALTGLSEGNVGYLIHHGLKRLTARLRPAGALKGVAS